jgi:1-deoxy-D-xylulose-5-phosphate reductoisomerase
MKRIAILGSTGSIGCNTLRVVEALPGEFGVAALGAGSKVELLAEQIERHRPQVVSVLDEENAARLLFELDRRNVTAKPKIGVGIDGLSEVATCPGVEIVIGALANKETLVIAGQLMTHAAERSGAELLPVDSEHNALHQCLNGVKRSELKRLILTASGGPFRSSSKEVIDNATPAQALKHPTWQMGAKITIDSATLMNKGLEVIEAHWLFKCSADEIDIVVHPQSVVHSMIELVDGSIIAQLGMTDMRHAIQYALTYPERRPTNLPGLDLMTLGKLEFFAPDTEKFPCVTIAYDALRIGGTMPAVLNAANEITVAAFLEGKIKFGDIPRLIRAACDAHVPQTASTLETVLAADKWAREWVSGGVREGF